MRPFGAPGRLPGTPPYNPPQAVTRDRARTTSSSRRPKTTGSRLVSPMRELERETLPSPLSAALGGALRTAAAGGYTTDQVTG